ncbi:hypothetical protein KBX73_03085 [Acetobacter persici]|uniref:hypothetical protein n=1 Tax=Acetobacter persici TaxID=1076596 RepID=UPI0020CFC9D4|nr:hypothetical protein [Acetobacter persici]MCP9318775.1 hypothetical protein [Acetobacter persici]
MENNHNLLNKENLLNIRYLILCAIFDPVYCEEIEIATGFSEKDFCMVSSKLYHIANTFNSKEIYDIFDHITIHDLIVARSCISRAEGSFGIYSNFFNKKEFFINIYKIEKNNLNSILSIYGE